MSPRGGREARKLPIADCGAASADGKPGICLSRIAVRRRRGSWRRRMWRGGTLRRGTLHDSAPLLRAHLTPLPPQFRASLGGHLPEPIEGLAHPLLLRRRQALELLPTLPQLLALLRRHGAPLREALLSARTLLG